MLINRKLGNLRDTTYNEDQVDWLTLEWYEASKRIQRKTTAKGEEFILKFLDESPEFSQGDILFRDTVRIVAIQINSCECLVIKVESMYEMASLAYEIGNKHLPLFFEGNEEDSAITRQGSMPSFLLVPTDLPLFKLLTAQGYQVLKEQRKLLRPLKTTVSPHGNSSGTSLFSRIMQLTNPEK